jgi:hypothetical protein
MTEMYKARLRMQDVLDRFKYNFIFPDYASIECLELSRVKTDGYYYHLTLSVKDGVISNETILLRPTVVDQPNIETVYTEAT